MSVGYANAYPTTTGGRFLTVVAQITGTLFLALPIGVIGSVFSKLYEAETTSKRGDKDSPVKRSVS